MILTLIWVWKAGFPLRKCCSSPFSINSGKGDLKNMSQTHYFHCKHSELFPSTAVAFGWICPRPFSEEGFSREERCFDIIVLLTAVATRVWMFIKTVCPLGLVWFLFRTGFSLLKKPCCVSDVDICSVPKCLHLPPVQKDFGHSSLINF